MDVLLCATELNLLIRHIVTLVMTVCHLKKIGFPGEKKFGKHWSVLYVTVPFIQSDIYVQM